MCVKFSSLFPPSFCHRIVSSLSLSFSVPSSFFPTLFLCLSLSGRFESGRGSPSRGGVASSRVESSRRVTLPRTTSAVFHSPQSPTREGAALPPFSVSERTRQKWHSFLQYRASRAPRCVSSLREILTRIEYKKIYNARSIIMTPEAKRGLPNSPPLPLLYAARVSLSLSLFVFACFFLLLLLPSSGDFYCYLLFTRG